MSRTLIGAVVFSVAVLTSRVSGAQVYQLPTPAPQVSAANAQWQAAGEPVLHGGFFYFPAGPAVFFDGTVMKRTGVHRGVPIYENATLEPSSIVYVPVGRNLMRPYERRREGPLAGTEGSRMSSFPIQRDSELSVGAGADRTWTSSPAGEWREMWAENQRAPVASGAMCCALPGHAGSLSTAVPSSAGAAAGPSAAATTGMQSIPAPDSSNGVWIVYEGARYYSDGVAVSYDSARFSPIGNYRGFPVFRETRVGGDRIFVTVVPNGPIAPFAPR